MATEGHPAMRKFHVVGMGLSLALLVGSVQAQEVAWRPAGAADSNSAPAVTLSAPVANQKPVIQPVGFAPGQAEQQPVVRAMRADDAKQMPAGPSLKGDNTPRPMPPIKDSGPTPGPGPVAEESWGSVVSKWVNGGNEPGMAPGSVPMYYEPDGGIACGPNCDDCGSGRRWSWKGLSLFNKADGCPDMCGTGCCAPRPCFWVRGEYLLWTVKDAPNPTLVTINPNRGSDPNFGTPGTVGVVGGSGEDYNFRSGGRFTLGFAPPCMHGWGFETTYFFLANRTSNTTVTSDGSFSVGRPFLETNPAFFFDNKTQSFVANNPNRAQLVAKDGVVAGSVSVDTSNELWGVEANFRRNLCCGCNYKVDFLTGFRYLQLDESLNITENLNVLGSSGGTFGRVGTVVVRDSFLTRNEFYGGQIGLDAECRWNRWFVGAVGKLALGSIRQTVIIDGSTTSSVSGTERGGLLAQPTNIGRDARDQFCIVPEAGLRLGYYFTERLRGYVGYDVLYMSNVVRPGDQVDTFVNSSYIPPRGTPIGPATPRYQVRSTDFWAQGVSFGLEWRY